MYNEKNIAVSRNPAHMDALSKRKVCSIKQIELKCSLETTNRPADVVLRAHFLEKRGIFFTKNLP